MVRPQRGRRLWVRLCWSRFISIAKLRKEETDRFDGWSLPRLQAGRISGLQRWNVSQAGRRRPWNQVVSLSLGLVRMMSSSHRKSITNQSGMVGHRAHLIQATLRQSCSEPMRFLAIQPRFSR